MEQFPALHAATHLPAGSDPLPLQALPLWRDYVPSVVCVGSGHTDPSVVISLAQMMLSDEAAWSGEDVDGGQMTTVLGRATILVDDDPGAGDGYAFAVSAVIAGWFPTSSGSPFGIIGTGVAIDVSANKIYPVFLTDNASPEDGGFTTLYTVGDNSGALAQVGPTFPFTFDAGDTIFAGTWMYAMKND